MVNECNALTNALAFNEPHLTLPAVGESVSISFPPEACFVLGAARDGALAGAGAGAEV
jgi:hypothetical protein